MSSFFMNGGGLVALDPPLLEVLIITISTIFVAVVLYPDGTTLPVNFKHASMFRLFFIHTASCLAFDILPRRRRLNSDVNILQLVAGINFALELLLFQLHSIDHAAVEGQYHWLLQLQLVVLLAATLLEIAMPTSFVISYARALSLLSQGAWTIVVGFVMWTPGLVPKGCFLNLEETLHRAKSLVNIVFSCFVIGLAIFAVTFNSLGVSIYGRGDVNYVEVDDNDVQVKEPL